LTKQEVLLKLQSVFDNVFVEPVVVTEQLSAADVEEWDSLVHITFVVAVEKAFGIRFSLGETESSENIGAFADLIVRKLDQKGQ
jgi:acyl carrier protein